MQTLCSTLTVIGVVWLYAPEALDEVPTVDKNRCRQNVFSRNRNAPGLGASLDMLGRLTARGVDTLNIVTPENGVNAHLQPSLPPASTVFSTRSELAHTLFYLDPPYWQTESYGAPFGIEEYEQMADIIGSIKGKRSSVSKIT
jgi:hypothetical protein